MRRLIENPIYEHPAVIGAYNYAKAKHDKTGKTRKNSGLPYFVHPEMVADVVAAYGGTDEEIEAALLHDTLEDTDATPEELEALYGPTVAQIVEEVTNVDSEVKRLGKENYINHELVELSDSALLLKLADCYCNSLDFPKPGQAERIARNLHYLLEFRPDLPENCKSLIKAFPLMDDVELESPTGDEYDDELYITASRKRTGNRLEEGLKLKAAILAGLLALGGFTHAKTVNRIPQRIERSVDAFSEEDMNQIKKVVEESKSLGLNKARTLEKLKHLPLENTEGQRKLIKQLSQEWGC